MRIFQLFLNQLGSSRSHTAFFIINLTKNKNPGSKIALVFLFVQFRSIGLKRHACFLLM